MRTISPLPIPVKKALKKLGQDIKDARLRRRLPMSLMSARAFISRTTLTKVERGDPAVSLGIYASVLFVLGLTPRLSDLADVNHDTLGKTLEEDRLPKRAHLPKYKGDQNDR